MVGEIANKTLKGSYVRFLRLSTEERPHAEGGDEEILN